MRCRYLQRSDEAYAMIGGSDEAQPIAVELCDWPDQHPERFENAPLWMLKMVSAGLAVQPERNCVGCPGFVSVREGEG